MGFTSVHILDIHTDSYSRLPLLILVNFGFDVVACIVLCCAFIPSKKNKSEVLIVNKTIDSENCIKE